SPDVGGGFGAKLRPYSGYVLAARAAMDVDDPVKWTATRTEEHSSMVHSRHHLIDAQVGVDDDGSIQGFTAETVAPVGAFLMPAGSSPPTNLGVMSKGQYDIPHGYVHTRGAYTNTAYLAAYRGAGRPEAAYWAERMIRIVADELGMDPVELRRRNQIDPDQFPYETHMGRVYDSGDYEHTMDVALEKIGYDEFRERQERARQDDRYLGIGVSSYVESCGSAPGWHEVGEVQVASDGTAIVKSGTAEIGTGHATAFTQIASDALGIPAEDIEIRLGDTDQTSYGGGTAGSRAVPVAGSAIRESADKLIEKASRIAAHALEVSADDVAFDDGEFHVVGAPDRAVTMEEVADLAYSPGDLPDDIDAGLEFTTYYDPENFTFTFGCHVAVVEVDPDSGEIEFERYIGVDDVGTQINPQVLEGQIHGGIVQGIGQALYEDAEYDANGQLTTGSLQDYAVPRAEHIPEMELDSTVTPSPHNPLGAKGVGEAGAIGAPPAIVNAVIDALEPFGVRDIDMPLTPERVWRAVEEGRN
ncbi:MAG: xanthine dehydrogenase family protein molybdopterin-binding subunit, partial [Salinirussus sp.]